VSGGAEANETQTGFQKALTALGPFQFNRGLRRRTSVSALVCCLRRSAAACFSRARTCHVGTANKRGLSHRSHGDGV
jgi:hypothetical protein